MLLTVDIIRQRAETLLIPEEAVVPERDRHFALVVDADDAVIRREIELGRRRPGEGEVLSGLEAGERVIVEGTSRVRKESKVTVQETR